MSVVVLLFAGLRERIGMRSLRVDDLERASTVGALIERLRTDYPALQGYPFAIAVNGAYTGIERELSEGDEVALIPPVSGG